MSLAPNATTPDFHLREGLDDLLEMLTYKRPAGSATELEFIHLYIDKLDPFIDGYGNRWIQVGDGDPKIMWSSHTDTVHHFEGRQHIIRNGTMVTAKTHSNKGNKMTNCLGADDTVGVWLMLQMIKAGVEGLYVFHREEEVGGGGSSWAAKNAKAMFEGVKFAIALDRAGYTNVITHQGFSRCCSDEFARSLSAALGNGFKPDDSGVFTDTANYTDVIGECTNLSVGYFNQHGPREALDIDFALELRDILISADFSNLVFKREPGEIDPDDYAFDTGWKKDTGIRNWDWTKYGTNYSSQSSSTAVVMGNSEFGRWIKNNPESTADFLEFMGFDRRDLELWQEKAML